MTYYTHVRGIVFNFHVRYQEYFHSDRRQKARYNFSQQVETAFAGRQGRQLINRSTVRPGQALWLPGGASMLWTMSSD